MYKLVIFDLDGTLLDTLGDLAAAGNYALEQMGLPVHPVESYKTFVGNGIPMLVRRMLPKEHSATHEERALELFGEYYSAHKMDRTKPYEGITDMLTELSQRGVICTVNTNKNHEFSSELIRKFFGDKVRDVMGMGIGFPPKPAPMAALELCKRYCEDRKNVLYVGDSNVDMRTGELAGLARCAVLWGFRSYDELAAFHPEFMADNAERLKHIILGR